MSVFEIQPNGRHNRLADPNFDDFRDQSNSFQAIAKYTAYPTAVSGGSEPTRSLVAPVKSVVHDSGQGSHVGWGPPAMGGTG